MRNAGLPPQVFEGNITADPEIKFTNSGVAFVTFSVACGERRFNKNTSEWEDGDTTFMRCVAWRELAENIAVSFRKGEPVFIRGVLRQRDYETREGEKRSTLEVDVQTAGHSLDRGTTSYARAGSGGAPGGGYAAAPAAPPARYATQPGGGFAQPGAAQPMTDWQQPAQPPQPAPAQQYQAPPQPAPAAPPAQHLPPGAGAVAWNTPQSAPPAPPAPTLGGFGGGFDDEQPF